MEREDFLFNTLVEAKRAYYFSDNPILTDKEFDEFEEELLRLNPNSKYFSMIGSEFSGLDKIEHSELMISMGKAKTAEDMNKWFKKLNLPGIEYCLQPKIDGLSASCKYVNGKLVYVATRGDGKTGQDVTHIAQYVLDIKKEILFTMNTIEIRGELYLPKNTEYNTKGKSLRNNCVGLINRKEDRENLKYVRFVAYQIVGDYHSETESNKIETLEKEGFHTVDYKVCITGGDISQYYKDYLDIKRAMWFYETDGIIITVNNTSLHDEIDSRWVVDHHHHYNIALKPPSEGKETQLKGVQWQVSRQGAIIPVAQFQGIDIGGARLERASLHNATNVEKLNLHIGDILFIERANDVIPYVKENRSVNEEQTNLIPTHCPSCESELIKKGVHLMCVNTECSEVKIQQIIYWVKEIDAPGVAEGTIRSLFEKGIIKNIKDLYLVKSSDLEGLEGFGDKKIDNFITSIQSRNRMSSVELLSKLGIPLVQEKSLNKLGINSIEEFLSFNNIDYVIGQNIISWKDDEQNIIFLKSLLSVIEVTEQLSIKNSKGFIAMTGKGPYPRKYIIEKIKAEGWEFSEAITKETNVLLCEDVLGNSSKLQKARKLGITLLNYTDFFNN